LPLIVNLALLSSCANPHFFPRMRPLFVGLDDRRVKDVDLVREQVTVRCGKRDRDRTIILNH